MCSRHSRHYKYVNRENIYIKNYNLNEEQKKKKLYKKNGKIGIKYLKIEKRKKTTEN